MSYCVKRYGHLYQINHEHSPNMVMSRDLASNSENFYFSPHSILNFKKSYQNWGKLAQEQKLQAKKQTVFWKKHLPVLTGLKHDLIEFKVQCLNVFCYYGNKSAILLFNSIFRITPEVSTKLYFVEIS